MSDCRFGVSPVNYPDPDPDCGSGASGLIFMVSFTYDSCISNNI